MYRFGWLLRWVSRPVAFKSTDKSMFVSDSASDMEKWDCDPVLLHLAYDDLAIDIHFFLWLGKHLWWCRSRRWVVRDQTYSHPLIWSESFNSLCIVHCFSGGGHHMLLCWQFTWVDVLQIMLLFIDLEVILNVSTFRAWYQTLEDQSRSATRAKVCRIPSLSLFRVGLQCIPWYKFWRRILSFRPFTQQFAFWKDSDTKKVIHQFQQFWLIK